MFIYLKYNDVDTGETTITFNEVGTTVEVKKIQKGFVVLKAENLADITAVIDAQDPAIEVSQISKELFVEATKDAEVVKAIDAAVGMRIREKYTLDDELSMAYKANDSISKVEFLAYRQEQVNIAKEQKAELGL
jgi:hypothetical protein